MVEETRTRGWLIAGRVQGVFFRDSTRQQARRLDLCGYAINLDDGRVEVVAQGEPDALNQLDAWLRQGPPAARVDEVSELPDADQRALEPGNFRVA